MTAVSIRKLINPVQAVVKSDRERSRRRKLSKPFLEQLVGDADGVRDDRE